MTHTGNSITSHRTAIWKWFMKNTHLMFDLGEQGMIRGVDLIMPLYENRTVPEEIPTLLENKTPPKTWSDCDWTWFEVHGKGRSFGTVEVTDLLFKTLCSQRKM